MAIKPVNTILTCDRERYVLKLWQRRLWEWKFKVTKSYPIAVGMAGLETPEGLYLINSRSNRPSWTMPDSDWIAPELRGKTLPYGDPNNPIKAGWLGIYEGAGIHGVSDEEADATLGSSASHGCIRMRISDVVELFDKTPLWTPIAIS